jgi:hypothetical protein
MRGVLFVTIALLYLAAADYAFSCDAVELKRYSVNGFTYTLEELQAIDVTEGKGYIHPDQLNFRGE